MTDADLSFTNLRFEEALQELEAIVERLERGEVSLDDAVAAYERGAQLKDLCQARLDEARLKVDKIRSKRSGAEGGSPEIEGVSPFDGDGA